MRSPWMRQHVEALGNVRTVILRMIPVVAVLRSRWDVPHALVSLMKINVVMQVRLILPVLLHVPAKRPAAALFSVNKKFIRLSYDIKKRCIQHLFSLAI